MEVQISAGCGVSGRVADRDDGLQDATGTLGQRPDSMRQERPAKGAECQRIASGEDGGLVPPDGQPQLSPDDRPQYVALAGHGDPFLSGLVSDALHRPASLPGLDVLHLQLLSDVAERAVPQDLASDIPLSAA